MTAEGVALVVVPIVVVVVSAIVGPLLLVAVNRKLDHKIGDPNGQGNVVEMLERALKHQGKQDDHTERILTRLGRIEAGQRKQDERLDALEGADA